MIVPNIWKNKKMFKTTNQITYWDNHSNSGIIMSVIRIMWIINSQLIPIMYQFFDYYMLLLIYWHHKNDSKNNSNHPKTKIMKITESTL